MTSYTDHTDRIVLNEEAWRRHQEALRSLSANDNYDGPSDARSIAEKIRQVTKMLGEGQDDSTTETNGERDDAA